MASGGDIGPWEEISADRKYASDRFAIPASHLTQYILKQVKRYWLIGQYVFKKIWHSLKAQYPRLSKLYTNHFPSVQIGQRMNGWDYSINFSSEILVGAVVFVVAAVNLVVFNPLKSEYNHNDNSLLAQLLRYHPAMNEQLADKQNTVSTTVTSEGVFSQANASNNDLLGTTEFAEVLPEETQIEDSGISKPNPDSIKSLVARQVQIYKTQPHDTVYTVAQQFGLSTKTIRETNSLPSNALMAGWDLIIPPVDGVVIQVTNPNLTLSDVAHYYSADIKQIVSKNGLEDEEDMVELGGYLVIPGGSLPKPKAPAAPKAPAPAPSPAPTNKKFAPFVPRSVTIKGNHRFAPGYCTDYVARNVAGITWGGNANQWMKNAAAQGVKVDRNPVVGAVLVTNENRRYGHVAKIDSVSGDKVTISEWNYAGLFKKTVRTLDIDDSVIKGVIHPNQRSQ